MEETSKAQDSDDTDVDGVQHEQVVKRCKVAEDTEVANGSGSGNTCEASTSTSCSSKSEEDKEKEQEDIISDDNPDPVTDTNLRGSSNDGASTVYGSLSHSIADVDSDSDDEDKPAVLLKSKPKHNWFIVPEIQSRQFGTSANKQSSQMFQQRCYGSLHCVERLELMYKLEKHSGCVNSLHFHPNGNLLASGSDDLEVVIWDWKLGNALLSFDSKHKSNVFQSKFLPLSGDMHIVTCARDGQVRLAQVSAQEGFRSSRRLGSHKGPCHKLATLPDQPQVILSAGEDGIVLRHDLRNPKAEKLLTTVGHDHCDVPWYTINSHPLHTQEFCIAGRDHSVRSYDLRKEGVALNKYCPFPSGQVSEAIHVTSAVYNHNGSEILASYNDEDIYLFDVNGTLGNYIHRYQGHRNGATIKGVNFFGPKSEFVVSGSDDGYVYFWEKDSEAIVQWLRADDNGVVNVLEPHPQLPFLCTSGLDPDIKVWVPSYERDPKLTDLADTVKSNLEAREHWSLMSTSEVEQSQVLWLLWRQFNNSSEQLRRVINFTDESSNHSSEDSSSSDWLSSTSGHDTDASDTPDGCAPS